MATDIKISQMPNATSLEGTELIPIVLGGVNKTTTPDKIKEGLATIKLLENKVDRDGDKVLSEKDFTTAYETKLKGIADNANNYIHPTGNGNNHIPQGGAEGLFLGYSAAGTAKWVNAPTATINTATSATLGGIKIGYTQSGKNYPIILDSDGKAYVTVPWTDTVYTHPTTAGNKHIPAGGSSGLILKWSADGTATWGTEKTYSEATTSAAGLMSAADKAKLDGIATSANNYVLPAASISALGGVKLGTEVADAAGENVTKEEYNALLASLRAAGIIALVLPAGLKMTVIEDVIDFNPPMIIEEGKQYMEDNIVYECIQTSKLPISNKLKDLEGFYVKTKK